MENENWMLIDLDVTNVCNRGCKICQDNSDVNNPIHFTRGDTKRLLRQVRKIGIPTAFILAGGGEPLLNPKLPEIVKMISDFDQTCWISLFTSGFLNDETEKIRLRRTIQNANKKKFTLCLSLHAFNKNYAQRFEETYKFALETRLMFLRIMATSTIDLENFKLLEEVLKKQGLKPLLVHEDIWSAWRKDCFLVPIYDEEYEEKLTAISHFSNCYYSIPDMGSLILSFNFLTSEGKARNSNYKTIPPPPCTTLLDREKIPHLRIDSAGNYFPHPCCNPKEYPHMAIGTLKDNIQDILEKKRIISQTMLGSIICDKRIPEQRKDLCSLCSKIKAEQDALA